MTDTVSKTPVWSPASGAARLSGLSAEVAAFAVAVGSTAVVAAALFFQHVLSIPPCPLCLEQRKFHYVAIPLALMIAVAALKRMPKKYLAAGLAVVGAILFAGAAVAAYHAGVEWKFWAGPADCSGPIAAFGKAGSLIDQMQATSVVRCDEAGWRFLGVSLAGYNGLVSLMLATLAWRAAFTQARQR